MDDLLSSFLGWWRQKSRSIGQRVKVRGREVFHRANCSEIIVQRRGRGGRDRRAFCGGAWI